MIARHEFPRKNIVSFARLLLVVAVVCSNTRNTAVAAALAATHNGGDDIDFSQPLKRAKNDSKDVLDCKMRQLFFETAQKAVPWKNDLQDVYDALEIPSRCGVSYKVYKTNNVINDDIERKKHIYKKSIHTFENKTKFRRIKKRNDKNDNLSRQKYVFYVCPHKGNDNYQHGNRTHPFATLQRALSATRDVVTSSNPDIYLRNSTMNTKIPRRTIVLGQGIHYLKETIVLTPVDENLTIRSASTTGGNHTAWLSGGILIDSQKIAWRRSNTKKNIWVADLSALEDVPASITGLFTIQPHQRMTLARYPNANVENWNAQGRYVPSNTNVEWLFPPFGNVPEFYSVDLSLTDNPTGFVKNNSVMSSYNMYGTGQGGVCATVWGNQPSYWCSNVSAGGWAEVDQAAALAGRLNIPQGLKLQDVNSDILKRAKQWKNPHGAILHVAHTQGWAWHMFNVSHTTVVSENHNDKEESSVTVHFDKGGWQGGRNWQCKDGKGHLSNCNGDDKKLHGGDWYVEGVLEELDVPGEFFFDTTKKLLYFYPEKDCDERIKNHFNNVVGSTMLKKRRMLDNTKSEPRCIPDMVATNLKTLIQVKGTKEQPVKGVHLQGLGFRDTAKTYMEPWSAPSGGDWALHRGGAIHLEGTEDVVLSDSYFHRLDGNAIMLSGYCRQTRVARSEFSWIGDGAIATWGDTDGYDATMGTQPRFSLIERNIMSNLGLYQKQSSGWGQNKACQTTIRDNVMYNLPRAAINFNDGLGGGNLVEGNVIFNACRESGDHGPINSWDRMPFLTDTSGTGPSFTPLPTHTVHNLIIANYGASQGFDNDDGSSWYHTHDNVFYEADGFKMDYGGTDSKFFNNLVYGGNCFGTGSFKKGHADIFENNTCILDDPRNSENNIGTLYQCSTEGMNPTNNRYFTNDGNASWTCLPYPNHFTLEEMKKKGFELGSTLNMIPDAETIISWAMDIIKSEPNYVNAD